MTGELTLAVPDEYRLEPVAVRVALVDQARQLFGPDRAKALWAALELPSMELKRPIRTRRNAEVDAFIHERLIIAQGSRIKALTLYQAFEKWRGADAPPLSMTAFGRALVAAGIPRWTSRVTFYLDIRFSPDPSEVTPLPLFTPP